MFVPSCVKAYGLALGCLGRMERIRTVCSSRISARNKMRRVQRPTRFQFELVVVGRLLQLAILLPPSPSRPLFFHPPHPTVFLGWAQTYSRVVHPTAAPRAGFTPPIRPVHNQALSLPNPIQPTHQTMARTEDSSGGPSPVRMTDQVDTVRRGDVRMMNQYRILGQVGKGQHGEVYLCEDTRDGDKQVVRRTSPALHLAVLTFLQYRR